MTTVAHSAKLFLLLGAIGISAAAVSSGLAAPILQNGNFDEDIEGWTAALGATLAWWDVDAHGTVGSGSAVITATGLPEVRSGSGAYQCVPVDPNAIYHLRATVAAPTNQQRRVFPGFRVAFHSSPGCAGMPLDLRVANWPDYVMGQRWSVWLTFRTPPEAQYAWIGLMSWADEATPNLNGSTAMTYWDDVVLTHVALRLVIPGVAAD